MSGRPESRDSPLPELEFGKVAASQPIISLCILSARSDLLGAAGAPSRAIQQPRFTQ
jgi:hypothetical protein